MADEVELDLPNFTNADKNPEAIYDIPVRVSTVLGKSPIQVRNLLRLGSNAVVELDHKVGEPVEIYVNDQLVARGELTLLDERLGVNLTEIIKTDLRKD